MKYELEAIITKFIYYKKDENGNAFVELRGTTIVDNENKKQKTSEYNILKAKKNDSIKSAKVKKRYAFDKSLTSVLSLLFANKSKATFEIDYEKKEIIAVEIKP